MAGHADAVNTEVSETDSTETSDSTHIHPGEHEVARSPKDGDATQAAGGRNPETGDAEDYEAAVDADVHDVSEVSDDAAPAKQPVSPVRLATALGLVMAVGIAALGGWFGFRDYQTHRIQQERELLIQVGRQGALNLTTIDWQHADADIQRILDSATGAFYEDFSKRSKPFVEVVQKAQSKSVGTVTEAGLESQSGDQAQVLVAVSVKTTSLAAAEPDSRHWRMRISVQKIGSDAKISNVAFVP